MNEKLRKTILNNNDLYEAVFKPHNINFDRNSEIWYSPEKVPPLYSNLVTVSENWKPDEMFRKIDENFKREKWDEWSVKDSFGILDLTNYKFQKLFAAQWFYLEAGKFAPAKAEANLWLKVIKTEEELSDWGIAWDKDENLGKQIFAPEMLNNPKVYFVAGFENGKIKCGCLLNETEDVLGISNFFADEKNIEYRSAIIKFAYDSIEFLDIVGYERTFLTEKLESINVEAIADLTVWLRQIDVC